MPPMTALNKSRRTATASAQQQTGRCVVQPGNEDPVLARAGLAVLHISHRSHPVALGGADLDQAPRHGLGKEGLAQPLGQLVAAELDALRILELDVVLILLSTIRLLSRMWYLRHGGTAGRVIWVCASLHAAASQQQDHMRICITDTQGLSACQTVDV